MPMMSPEDVQAFLTRKGWSDAEMERQSGYSRNTLAKYKAEGAPLQFALVCAALTANLPPWQSTPFSGRPEDIPHIRRSYWSVTMTPNGPSSSMEAWVDAVTDPTDPEYSEERFREIADAVSRLVHSQDGPDSVTIRSCREA